MRTTFLVVCGLLALSAKGQSIVGKWQLSEQKTCFEGEMKESDTEKELKGSMEATSSTAVARVLTLDDKGRAEEEIMSAGKKKSSSKEAFKYQISGSEFQVLDKKSGLVTERWVIDELSETSLKMHDAVRDCETKTYIKVK